MKRLLILGVVGVAALALGIALAVAATTGGQQTTKSGGTTVGIKRVGSAGTVLVDARGKALYMSDQERRGMVLCTGACLSFWQPLTVSGTPKASPAVGRLGVVRRPDGKRQVTLKGRPLYAFKLDKAGKVTGDGFKDAFGGQRFTWHVARPAGATSAPTTSPGTTTTTPYHY